jgi:hypothetical protein
LNAAVHGPEKQLADRPAVPNNAKWDLRSFPGLSHG